MENEIVTKFTPNTQKGYYWKMENDNHVTNNGHEIMILEKTGNNIIIDIDRCCNVELTQKEIKELIKELKKHIVKKRIKMNSFKVKFYFYNYNKEKCFDAIIVHNCSTFEQAKSKARKELKELHAIHKCRIINVELKGGSN